MGKKLGAVLVGLGVLLLAFGLLSKFYAYPRLAMVPANQNSVTYAVAKDATVFSIKDLAEKQIDLVTTVNTVGDVNASKQISDKLGKKVAVWEQMTYSDTADYNKASGQAPLSASHQRIAFDANTGEAVQCCGTYVTDGADLDTGTEKRNADVKFEGLVTKFPFNTQKKAYKYWDGTLQKAMPMSYKGTVKLHGATTYKFQMEVPETNIGTMTVPASVFKIPATGDVTLDKMYTNKVTYWVEPETGAYVNVESNPNQWVTYQGNKVGTLTDATATYRDSDVKKNAKDYASKATMLKVMRLWFPLVGSILGLLLIIAGVVLTLNGRRREGDASTA